MRWHELRTRWQELDPRIRARLVALARERLGVTEDGKEIDVETWASNVDADLEDVFELEELEEMMSHPGKDDIHEQREIDQDVEGLIHWPPHVREPPGTDGGRR